MWFMDMFCNRCAKEECPESFEGCPILADTMIYGVDDPRYPKEWIRDENGPCCTAFLCPHCFNIGGSARDKSAPCPNCGMMYKG